MPHCICPGTDFMFLAIFLITPFLFGSRESEATGYLRINRLPPS